MDVVVKSRHCNVSDQFRSYVDEKITRLSKLNDRAIRVEVEVSAERNRRQQNQASRVEITLRTKGSSRITADRWRCIGDQRVVGAPDRRD